MKENFRLIHINRILVIIICFVTGRSFAQSESAGILQQQFITYQLNNYNEKIFVHTDKTFYLAGESIWFKIYCVDENFHRPSAVSKVAYVEILSKENKAVLQATIALNDGSGNGSFIIPSFITSGNYTIRAYTKWMENFDAAYYFEAPITIVNTLKTGAWQEEAQKNQYDISFFPEGGNLVEGLSAKVAFKAVDKFGEPVDCSGTVMDEQNNTEVNFQSLKFGMGNFSFTPKVNAIYKAIVKLGDTTIIKPLPSSYKQGFVMRVENNDDTHIKIIVSSNIPGEDAAYLLVHSQNVLKDFQQSSLANGTFVFITDKNKLADGISTFTIFNTKKQPVCERLYFKRPVAKLIIKTQADQNTYAIRKPVNISLAAIDNAGKPAITDMSVAVFMVDSLQTEEYPDILSYLLLGSELKGNITAPSYYFQDSGKDVGEAADNLMLTQGWRRFKWEDILQDKKNYFDYIPEHEGIIITGKITGRLNNLPVPNINAILTVPGENFQLANAKSDGAGNLQFNVKDFYGGDNLIIQTDSSYKADIVSPYSNKFSQRPVPLFSMPLQWKDELLFRSINAQAENAYLINEKQHAYLYDAEDTSLFYGKPDKRYYLDDYTRFITMEEVMREYVAEVRVRKEAQQFHFKVLDYTPQTFFNNDPLILLDGLPVANVNSIMEFDPLKIKRLDVITRKYYYGNIIADGIVSYTTYKGDLADYALNAGEVVIKYDGMQREREFYSPIYTTDEQMKNHLPDVRNVLYWSPKIKTGTDGKANFNFYTSDLKGKFACVIQGITKDGLAGSRIITFDVAK